MVKRSCMQTDLIGGMLLASGVLLAGCGSLGTKDYMVINEALKEESLQAQRAAANLHVDVQTLQQQLGSMRAAQARLQGDFQDADRRLAEAQRVADLQREDVNRAKAERDQALQASRQLQGQLSELERLRQQVADAEREQKRIRTLQASIKKLTKEVANLNTALRDSLARSKPAPAVSTQEPVDTSPAEAMNRPRSIIIKAGDTLYSLAKKYAVALTELKILNRLTTDLILVGQALILPEP
jgi:TolA-binding protein